MGFVAALLVLSAAMPSAAEDAALMGALKRVSCPPKAVTLVKTTDNTRVYNIVCVGAPARELIVTCVRGRCDPSDASPPSEDDGQLDAP